jgi:hypothetical protein
MASTTPSTPATFTWSPTLKGRKMSSMTPDAKLVSVPCSARPMARPAAAMRPAKLMVCTPKTPKQATPTLTRML